MITLPFKYTDYSDNIEEFEAKFENIKKEKILKGDDIKNILLGYLSKKYLVAAERNYRGINENPFDLIIGDERTLDLVGFEIKGDTDNFSRLKTQLQAYLFVFDGVYLVLHKKNRPEWLPEYVGVIRVFENKEVYVEKYPYIRNEFEISTDYEWDSLFRSNNLGISYSQTKQAMRVVQGVRHNILFNRFFAITSGFNTHKFEKFYPLTDEQKTVIMGFDIPFHFKIMNKDLKKFEKRLEILKKAIMVGQTGLKKFTK